MAYDRRVDWLRNKTCVGLNLPEHYFDELLNDPEQSSKVNEFLEAGDDASALLFSVEAVTIYVQETLTVEAESEKPTEGEEGEAGEAAENGETPAEDGAEASEATPAEANGEAPAEGEEPKPAEEPAATEAPKEEEAKPEESSSEQPPGTPAAAEEAPQTATDSEQPQQESEQETNEDGTGEGAPDGEYPGSKPATPSGIDLEIAPPPPKTMLRTVTVPKETFKVHLSVNNLPEELSGLRSCFFLRSRPGKITYDDIEDSLETGTLTEGLSLKALEQVSMINHIL